MFFLKSLLLPLQRFNLGRELKHLFKINLNKKHGAILHGSFQFLAICFFQLKSFMDLHPVWNFNRVWKILHSITIFGVWTIASFSAIPKGKSPLKVVVITNFHTFFTQLPKTHHLLQWNLCSPKSVCQAKSSLILFSDYQLYTLLIARQD